MSKNTNKTVATSQSPEMYLHSLPKEQQVDAKSLMQIMTKLTKSPPRMWGTSIIGFGDYHYKYESGREGDWFQLGFAARKKQMTVYIGCGMQKIDQFKEKLGKYKLGVGCLYFQKLDDLNIQVFKKLLQESLKALKNQQLTDKQKFGVVTKKEAGHEGKRKNGAKD